MSGHVYTVTPLPGERFRMECGAVTIEAGEDAAQRFLIAESIRLRGERLRSTTRAQIRRDLTQWGMLISAEDARYWLVRMVGAGQIKMVPGEGGRSRRNHYMIRPEWADEVAARAQLAIAKATAA